MIGFLREVDLCLPLLVVLVLSRRQYPVRQVPYYSWTGLSTRRKEQERVLYENHATETCFDNFNQLLGIRMTHLMNDARDNQFSALTFSFFLSKRRRSSCDSRSSRLGS